MIYLLDTDHVTVIQRGGPDASPPLSRLRGLSPDDYGTTIVTYEEQFRGWADWLNRAKTSETRIEAYRALSDHLRFFSAIAVWDYTRDAETLAETLFAAWHSMIRVGTKDLRITAIATAYGATLLTRNNKDFSRVPGLICADWTV